MRIELRRAGERRGRRLHVAPDALPVGQLCVCGFDVIEHEDSGLCTACHLHLLAEQHEREAEDRERHEREERIAEAQRRLDAARQRKHRAGAPT